VQEDSHSKIANHTNYCCDKTTHAPKSAMPDAKINATMMGDEMRFMVA